ncbi:MAG TPA: PQQ-binding-like beta-propeller repeat protein [Tepidisphaeraceae bacterium]|nr:PQQ-binding-like beta-propeller repeat protein [Tepidisphaeraceae bacterium]
MPALHLVFVLLLGSLARAENWPQWRGPRGDGTSTEENVPTKWSGTANVRWKTEIPGIGHSSPVIWGDRIFVTTCLEGNQERELLCLDRVSGKILWQKQVLKSPLEHKHRLNSYASGTPATDGKYVWVAFFEIPKIELVCYDFEGNEVWRKSPGEFHSVHGFCSSPVLYKDLLILNCDQDSESACIVAYDRNTGAEKWRTLRPNKTRSYSTPIIRELAGKEQLVLSGSKCVASYDPNTGKQLWIVDGPTEQFVASLVVTDGIIFVTGGFPTLHLEGINPDGSGNVTNSHVMWHEHGSVASYVPSPIAAGDWFFVVSDGGVASCWEAKTGKQLWKQRLGQHHSASPVSAGGNLYFPADNGDVYVFRASSSYEPVSLNSLGEEMRASPAISGGEIFLRGVHNLYCISNAK